MSELTFTGYAVLGLLTRQPWTAYELEQQARRSLNYVMPRSRSVLFNEPKKLARRGFATEHPEVRGNRTVAVYEITDKGRAAFAQWLTTPPGLPQLEADVLVRVLFAHETSDAQLIETLHQFRELTLPLFEQGFVQVQEYLHDGGGPFPDELMYIVMNGQFVLEYLRLLHEWARWAEASVKSWPRSAAGRRRWAIEQIERWLVEGEQMNELINADDPPNMARFTTPSVAAPPARRPAATPAPPAKAAAPRGTRRHVESAPTAAARRAGPRR